MAEGADSPRAHFNLLTTTATDLQTKLNAGHLTSVDLVNSYLAQIAENNDYLRAVFETAPRALLTQLAKQLDDERQAGNLRSTLHGIPILIKVRNSVVMITRFNFFPPIRTTLRRILIWG